VTGREVLETPLRLKNLGRRWSPRSVRHCGFGDSRLLRGREEDRQPGLLPRDAPGRQEGENAEDDDRTRDPHPDSEATGLTGGAGGGISGGIGLS